MKRAQTLAAKGDDSKIELAEALADLAEAAHRPTLAEPVSRMNLSRRTICHLLKVWQAFSDLGIPRERLVGTGWTKQAVIAETCEPREEKQALALADTCTAKELPALLKGAPRKAKARTVQLRLTPRQYVQFETRPAGEWRSSPQEGAGPLRQGGGPDEGAGAVAAPIPSKGMVFALGTLRKRPKQWILLGMIRLDETQQTTFAFGP
jgi:hypothetical protein